MGDENECGRKSYPSGSVYSPGMFASVNTSKEFAHLLGVPEKSISLVVPTNTPCRSNGCPFNAIQRNNGHCPVHRRTWYPLLSSRGGDLHGLDFLHADKWYHDCSCNDESCTSAGYFPKQGAIYIPASGRSTVIGSPGLKLSDETAPTDIWLYPWHFFPEHLKKNEKGHWELDYDKDVKRDYWDLERHSPYPFPPPRNTPQIWIRDVYCSDDYVRPQERWATTNPTTKMPTWMLNMLAIDQPTNNTNQQQNNNNNNKKKISIAQLERRVEMFEARSRQLLKEKKEQEEVHCKLVAASEKKHNNELSKLKTNYDQQICGMKRRYEHISKEKDIIIQNQKEKISKLEEENAQYKEELERLRRELKECRKMKGQPLTYEDLRDDGILAKRVGACTFFDTVRQNDAFLALMNFTDGEGCFPEGDGLLENIRSYSHVKRDERDGVYECPSMDMESPEYKTWLKKSKAAREGGRTWKDDYLAFCLYVRAGCTEEFVSSLCGISVGRMSDIIHGYAQVLDDGLVELFPRPTRSQILRAYPVRFLEADGHAKCTLLLDAFEVFCQDSSNPNVSSSTHSDYKKHCTIKFLGGCCPIGCPWGDTVPDGNPGRASDVAMTEDTQILRQVPFGNTCKVDKGFICENQAIGEGVYIDRPQKRLKKQTQQSAVDTAQTQKLGNTRIIVENLNGELKGQVRYLNCLIPCLQFPIISKLVRAGYLLQNLKKPIIQNNNPRDTKLEDGCPCRAEVRYYGATAPGLVDIRGEIHLWGMDCEIKRHKQLSDMHVDKSPIEISEMVLEERWDLKMRKMLYQLHGKEYDGGDL